MGMSGPRIFVLNPAVVDDDLRAAFASLADALAEIEVEVPESRLARLREEAMVRQLWPLAQAHRTKAGAWFRIVGFGVSLRHQCLNVLSPDLGRVGQALRYVAKGEL